MQENKVPAWLLERKEEAETKPVQAPDGTWVVWPFNGGYAEIVPIMDIAHRLMAEKILDAMNEAYDAGRHYGQDFC